MEHFRALLQANQLKSTHQRLAILEAIERFGHIDIDTLYTTITQKYPTMSKATLYRNINDLMSFSILEEVKLPHQKQHYEIKKVPHVHLICTKCGGIEDIFIETKPLLETISLQSGFQIQKSFIVMNGVCKRCSGKK